MGREAEMLFSEMHPIKTHEDRSKECSLTIFHLRFIQQTLIEHLLCNRDCGRCNQYGSEVERRDRGTGSEDPTGPEHRAI